MRHDILQHVQPAMEKMLASGNHHHGQILRPCPVEHRRKRYHVVQFAVNDQRAARNRTGLEPADRGRHQYQLLRLYLFRNARLNKTSKRKTRTNERQTAVTLLRVPRDGNQIVGFAAALVVRTTTCTHAAKVRAQRDVSERDKCARQRGYHFVILCTAHQRMGVCDHGDAAYRVAGFLDIDFDSAGSPCQQFGVRFGPRHLEFCNDRRAPGAMHPSEPRCARLRPCIVCGSL